MKSKGRSLGPEFFRRKPVDCARGLIGCIFDWQGCSGVIVETEAYAAEGDEACHTFFRPSARAFVSKHEPGAAYVYLNYGVHWLFNILVKGPGGEGFVLFRALEPLEGIATMQSRRPNCRKSREYCSGPGKLTQALGIDGTDHGREFLHEGPRMGIRVGNDRAVVEAPRIGISRAKALNWRFLAEDSDCLSVPVGRSAR